MLWRHRVRQALWQREYEAAVGGGSFRLAFPSCVTLIPTEACNLRCPMCNQWGENGYFLSGAREATHMDPDALSFLVRSLSPADSLISVHGGEPFAYKHMDVLLALLSEQPFDVVFS